MSLKVPESMKLEHEELHSELEKATLERGAIGDAGKAVAKVLEPHFAKEEEFAMPPLGLLATLAKNRVPAEMKDALIMTDRLETGLDEMLKEHKEIVTNLKNLVSIARKERKLEYVSFADKLIRHAQAEEEVYYPASLLIGKFLKLKFRQ
jgi:hemerythrin